MEVTKRQQMIRSPLNCDLDQSDACCSSSPFDIVIAVDAVKGRKTERTRSETGDVSPGFRYESEYSLLKQVTEVYRSVFNVTIWGSLLDF